MGDPPLYTSCIASTRRAGEVDFENITGSTGTNGGKYFIVILKYGLYQYFYFRPFVYNAAGSFNAIDAGISISINNTSGFVFFILKSGSLQSAKHHSR
jgi:hypothetical protein